MFKKKKNAKTSLQKYYGKTWGWGRNTKIPAQTDYS